MEHEALGREAGVASPAGEQGLFQGGHDQRRGLGGRHPPAQDPSRAHVADEAGVHKALQGPHVGEIRDPPLVRPGRHTPPPTDQVGVPSRCRIPLGGRRRVLAPTGAFDPNDAHQPGGLVPADIVAGFAHGRGQLVGPVEAAVRPPDAQGHVGHLSVIPGGLGHRSRPVGVVRARGDRHVVLGEHPADRLDPEPVPKLVDVGDDQRSLRSSSA